MKQVIVFPRGQLTAADRSALIKAGMVAVEADSPHLVVTHVPSSARVGSNDLLMAALHGASEGGIVGQAAMMTELYRRMKAKEARP